MSAATATASTPSASRLSPRMKSLLPYAVVVVVVIAMGFGTKFVSTNSAVASGPKKFSAADFGRTQFPKVQAEIKQRAVAATTLAAAIKKNQTAAGKRYGVDTGTGPEISVSFTGVVGKGDSGIYPVTVSGVPKGTLIRIQTGPAINGTDLRDATGKIMFGQFTNQIDYQNAASALNQQMKQKVLTPVHPATLQGKTVSVVGVFELINPTGWLVTPSQLSVK